MTAPQIVSDLGEDAASSFVLLQDTDEATCLLPQAGE